MVENVRHRLVLREVVKSITEVTQITHGEKNEAGAPVIHTQRVGYALRLGSGVSWVFEEKPPFEAGQDIIVTFEGSPIITQ